MLPPERYIFQHIISYAARRHKTRYGYKKAEKSTVSICCPLRRNTLRGYNGSGDFMKRLFSPLSEEAFGMVRGTLCVSCAMLFCSAIILLHIGELAPRTYALYRLAAELETASGGFLLLGNAAAFVLERARRR